MANSYFKFKQFTVHQEHCVMKLTTDACLFGGWVAREVRSRRSEVGSQQSEVGRMLDIGTGTGLLALMLAQQVDVKIDAIEIDADAFEQAKENINASTWANRIHIIHADIKEFIFPEPYDVIISNPPFYENEWRSEDPKKNVAHHSDSLLLEELLAIIRKNLKVDGSFFLLLPFKRDSQIRNLLVKHNFGIEQIILVSQSVKHGHFRMMIKGNLKGSEAAETVIDEISIWDEKQQYTPVFVELLKEYYLYL